MPNPILCPESISDWEVAHSVMRTELNGMVYAHCPNFKAAGAQMDWDKAQRENDYRLWLFSKTPQGFTEWMRERRGGQ